MCGLLGLGRAGSANPGQPNPWRILLLVSGCGLFVYLVMRLGAREIARSIVEIGWYFAIAAAVYMTWELMRALAYRECIAVSGACPYWDVLRFRLSGEAIQFLTSTGPFLAEPAKMWLLRKHGFTAKQAAAATLCEYLLYMFASVALSAAGLACFLATFHLSGVAADTALSLLSISAAFLAVSVWAIARRIYVIGTIVKWIHAIPRIGMRLRFQDQDVQQTEDLMFAVFRDHPRRCLSILAIEAVAQVLLIFELFVLLAAIKQSTSFYRAFLIEAATKFISLAFFFIPGQVGAAEGTYALMFRAMGWPASAGFALAVARRLRSLLAAGLGLMLAPMWRDQPPPAEPR